MDNILHLKEFTSEGLLLKASQTIKKDHSPEFYAGMVFGLNVILEKIAASPQTTNDEIAQEIAALVACAISQVQQHNQYIPDRDNK